jgi:threonine 3-dehydrogenase
MIEELKRYFPELKYSYDPDFRDAIAKSWPESLDDTLARNDWGWNPKCKDVGSLVDEVLQYIKKHYKPIH